jgi:hypothetical protein
MLSMPSSLSARSTCSRSHSRGDASVYLNSELSGRHSSVLTTAVGANNSSRCCSLFQNQRARPHGPHIIVSLMLFCVQ